MGGPKSREHRSPRCRPRPRGRRRRLRGCRARWRSGGRWSSVVCRMLASTIEDARLLAGVSVADNADFISNYRSSLINWHLRPKKSGPPGPLLGNEACPYFFLSSAIGIGFSSIIFLHSAFIFSSALGSIFLQAAILSALSLSDMAPP